MWNRFFSDAKVVPTDFERKNVSLICAFIQFSNEAKTKREAKIHKTVFVKPIKPIATEYANVWVTIFSKF